MLQNDAKTWKMTETLPNGYSSESAQQELSNEYQHDRVKMVFQNRCGFVLLPKVASALEGLSDKCHLRMYHESQPINKSPNTP